MKKALKHSTKIFIEVVCGVLILLIIALGVFAWKLSQGPIDLVKFVPYVEEQFALNSKDQSIEIKSLVLNWNGFQNPLGLKATDIDISNDNGAYLHSPEVDMDISYRWLFLGKLKFQTIWVRNTTISITKTTDGLFKITGQDVKEDKPVTQLSSAKLSLDNIIDDLPFVEQLWIDDANIIYRDEVTETVQLFDPVTFFVEMKKTGGRHNLFGFLTLPLSEGEKENTVKLNFSTQNNPTLLNVNGSLSDMPIESFLQFLPSMPDGVTLETIVDANIQTQLDDQFKLHQMDLSISASDGFINFPLNDKEETVDFKDLSTEITHDPKTDMLNISDFSILINDTANVMLTGNLMNSQDVDNVAGNLNLSIQNFPQSYLGQYWPKQYSDNGAYRWLVEKINGGVFNNLNITSVFDMGAIDRNDGKTLPPQIISVKGDMIYDGLNIQYHPEMAMAKNVSGSGKYNDVELALDVERADIGGMITKGAYLHFDDLITEGKGMGTLKFPVTSNAQNIFDYISREPIAAFKNTDFKPKNTKGDVEAIIDLKIPLLKDLPVEDIKVDVNGRVDNAEIPNAVKGLTLSGGPFDISATTEDIKVNGTGELSGQAITLDWHEYFSARPNRDYVSKVTANVIANDKIRRAFTNDFADYFKGKSSGDIKYVKLSNNRDATIDLTLNTTATHIVVPSLGIDKPSGKTSSATTTIKLKNGDLVAVQNLNIKGSEFSIDNGNLNFRTEQGEPLITKANIKNITFNDNKLDVAMAEQDGLLKTTVTGQFLDIEPLLSGSKSDGDSQGGIERPREYGVDVSEIRSSADSETLKKPKAYIRFDRNGKIDRFELDALLGKNGDEGDLYIRYTPDEVSDGLSLRVESNNAGETLRAFGLYPHIRGGQLQIAGKPLDGGRFGDVLGRARINNFRISNAPVLLRLVNALSFQNFLQAGALSFTRLESDFEWKLGETGDIYNVSNGRTSGTSVAITFDGVIDTAKDEMSITGTAAPLSEINNFIGKIPVIGQILTGGDALLAATYSVKGNPDNPSVSVNPLSILTPGIIRKMLFENTSKTKEDDNATKEQLKGKDTMEIRGLN